MFFSEKHHKMLDGTCAKCFDLCPFTPNNPKSNTPTSSTSTTKQRQQQHHQYQHQHQQQLQQQQHLQQNVAAFKTKRSPSDFSIRKLTGDHHHHHQHHHHHHHRRDGGGGGSGRSTQAPAMAAKNGSSPPDLYFPPAAALAAGAGGMRQISPVPMTSPFGSLYGAGGGCGGHRPWLLGPAGSPVPGVFRAASSSSSSPSSFVVSAAAAAAAAQFSAAAASPAGMMACVLKDMAASLPPYAAALFGGVKTSTPVSSFVSPDVLARGGGFLPAAHAPPSPAAAYPVLNLSPAGAGSGSGGGGGGGGGHCAAGGGWKHHAVGVQGL